MPIADTEAQYEAVKPEQLLPGVAQIAKTSDFSRFEDGSLPVYAVGDNVLKLYPPVHRTECELEAGVLQAIEGRLCIPTPQVRATGELDGWTYLLMSRLYGERISELTPDIAEQLGQALAQLHSLDTNAGQRVDWPAFVETQRQNCVQRHRKQGLSEHWLEQIPDFVDIPLDVRTSLLHTEVMHQHLLVHNGRLSGLFDFEPAMHGAPEYEFAAAGPYLSQGDGDFLSRMLRAYGYPTFDDQLQRRLLAHFLLHRFSNLRVTLEIVPTTATTLDDLAERWWRLT
jgi:hygromycin-B 7''-O-kinase